MKKILAISYSQSGQLHEILENFLKPFASFDIDRVKVKPVNDFPFPWTSPVFFDAMPETVLEEPRELAPYELAHDCYDLVIFGYQPWYLSPSQPAAALLQDPKFRHVLKDTPVATVIGARNMWLKSQESIVREVESAGGFIVANVPLIDRVQNHVSAFTILHWMLTGKKTKKWGFLPVPGVSHEDIVTADKYAEPLAAALPTAHFKGVQKQILDKGGINVFASIMLVESRGKMLFKVWANLIKKKGTTPEIRAKWVNRFKWYLVTALFVISPPILIIYTLLRPIMFLKIRKNKQHYLYLGIEN